MEELINLKVVVNSLVFALIGMVVFVLGFYTFDRITPYALWKEIVEEENLALAIVVGSVAIGISTIIAAAIHG
jgi:putative membrane protein